MLVKRILSSRDPTVIANATYTIRYEGGHFYICPLPFVVRTCRHRLMPVPMSIKTTDSGIDFNSLMESVKRGNVQIMQMLLEHGANVNAGDMLGQTAMHWYLIQCASDQVEMMELLVKHGADVNATTRDSETPIDLGLQEGDLLHLSSGYSNTARTLIYPQAYQRSSTCMGRLRRCYHRFKSNDFRSCQLRAPSSLFGAGGRFGPHRGRAISRLPLALRNAVLHGVRTRQATSVCSRLPGCSFGRIHTRALDGLNRDGRGPLMSFLSFRPVPFASKHHDIYLAFIKLLDAMNAIHYGGCLWILRGREVAPDRWETALGHACELGLVKVVEAAALVRGGPRAASPRQAAA